MNMDHCINSNLIENNVPANAGWYRQEKLKQHIATYKILQAKLTIAETIFENLDVMDPPIEVLQQINYAINDREQNVMASRDGWKLLRKEMYPFLLIMTFMFVALVASFFVLLFYYFKPQF